MTDVEDHHLPSEVVHVVAKHAPLPFAPRKTTMCGVATIFVLYDLRVNVYRNSPSLIKMDLSSSAISVT